MADAALETERLILRAWRDADAAPFQAICTDPLSEGNPFAPMSPTA